MTRIITAFSLLLLALLLTGCFDNKVELPGRIMGKGICPDKNKPFLRVIYRRVNQSWAETYYVSQAEYDAAHSDDPWPPVREPESEPDPEKTEEANVCKCGASDVGIDIQTQRIGAFTFWIVTMIAMLTLRRLHRSRTKKS